MSLLQDIEITSLREDQTDILIFKTNVVNNQDVEKIALVLGEESRIVKWNIDLADIDKVLRMESKQFREQEVITYMMRAGYQCQELND